MPTSTQTTETGPAGTPQPRAEDRPSPTAKAVVRPGDRIFSTATLLAGILILLTLAG
ncbi:phosphate ABC transporter permease subunit PstC, partial [Burkholderia multivorans]